MVKDFNESLKPIIIKTGSRIIKEISCVVLWHIICWRHDADNYLVLKNIVLNANKNVIILQVRDQKLPDTKACVSYQDECGPFSCCIFNNITSPLMDFEACANYIWKTHPDCCSLCKFINTKYFWPFKTFANMQLNNLGNKTWEDSINDTEMSINNDEDNNKLQVMPSKKEKEPAKKILDLWIINKD